MGCPFSAARGWIQFALKALPTVQLLAFEWSCGGFSRTFPHSNIDECVQKIGHEAVLSQFPPI